MDTQVRFNKHMTRSLDRTGWLTVRIMGLSGISGHAGGGLVSQASNSYKVAMSVHCHKSAPI